MTTSYFNTNLLLHLFNCKAFHTKQIVLHILLESEEGADGEIKVEGGVNFRIFR